MRRQEVTGFIVSHHTDGGRHHFFLQPFDVVIYLITPLLIWLVNLLKQA